MKHWITKKQVLLLSGIGAGLFFFIAGTRGVPLLCTQNDIMCMKQYDSIASAILGFLPFFLFSLVTYKMHDKVFRAWSNFALVWIPLSIIVTAITPDTSGFLQVIDKEFVAIIFSGLFVLISLIFITYKHFTLK